MVDPTVGEAKRRDVEPPALDNAAAAEDPLDGRVVLPGTLERSPLGVNTRAVRRGNSNWPTAAITATINIASNIT